jgi:hypothetical protein
METGTTVTSSGMIYSSLKFKWAHLLLGCTCLYLREMNQTGGLEILLIHYAQKDLLKHTEVLWVKIPNTIYALFTSCFIGRHLNKRVLPNKWKFIRPYPSPIGHKSLFIFRSDAVRKFRIKNNPEPRNVLLLRKKVSSKGVSATLNCLFWGHYFSVLPFSQEYFPT